MAYSDKVLDHYENPRNVGKLDDDDKNVGGSAIASSSLLTEWVKGRSLDQATEIKNKDIANELGLPPVKIHCSVLAEDAIRAAIADVKSKRGEEISEGSE